MGGCYPIWNGGDSIVEPTPGHRRCAVKQVANRVGQVVVDQVTETLLLKVAVVSKGDIPKQVPAHRIPTTVFKQAFWIEHIAQGFTHLLAFPRQEAVAKHPFRQGQACGEQHRWPIDGMEAEDVLTDHVKLGWPAPGADQGQIRLFVRIEKGREVTQKGIEPHIKGMARVAGHGNAPGQVNPGDGEIPETLGYEVFYFFFAAARCNKAWLGDQRFDLLLIAG